MLQEGPRTYSSSEISPDLPQDINSLIVKKEWWKTFIGYIIAAIPIIFGCLIEYELALTSGSSSAQLDVNTISGLFKFKGGAGAGLVAIGLIIIFITNFKIKTKSARVQERNEIISMKIKAIQQQLDDETIDNKEYKMIKKELLDSILNSDLKWWNPLDWFRKVKIPKKIQGNTI
jgi:hypothetical protein